MAKILLSVHAIGSAFLAIPELEIDEKEAALLADAAAEVAKHYDIIPDPKTQAWVNLAMVMGAVYGPRVWVHYHKRTAPSATAPGAEPPLETGVVRAWTRSAGTA